MNKHLRIFSWAMALACVLCLIGAQSAFAQKPVGAGSGFITGNDSARILEIAKNYGTAELKALDNGAPYISGTIDGSLYSVFFSGCTNGRDCTELRFVAWWDGSQGMTERQLNSWNAEKFFGKLYIDSDGDLTAELYVNLSHGAVPDTLDDDFDWWRIILDQVKEII